MKFTMGLVWHNCLTYKPSEKYNPCLFVTDGTNFYKVVYKQDVGFVGDGVFIDDSTAENYWWADMLQTIGGSELFEKSKTCNQLRDN